MIGPTGRFRATRGFQLEGGHVVRAGDQVDMTDPALISALLQARKIQPRDKATEARVTWKHAAQWAPAPERTRAGYNPVDW